MEAFFDLNIFIIKRTRAEISGGIYTERMEILRIHISGKVPRSGSAEGQPGRQGGNRMEYRITDTLIEQFRKQLTDEEKAPSTIEKYVRDVRNFLQYAGEGMEVTKELTMAYKKKLQTEYSPAAVNSMLAALNGFLKRMNWHDCVVKSLKWQKEAFRSTKKELTKEEYLCLVKEAGKQGKTRLFLILQTLCSTGIRISELQFITVEALKKGRAVVRSKGKQRTVLLPDKLCIQLRRYIQPGTRGSIFVTRNGKPVDRSNIFHEMKKICEAAGISREKVYPHNLRHLFARTYYQARRDITHLADLLGHASINTTRIYTIVSDREQIRQIDHLGLVLQIE